jgi:hypothetical protein
MPQQFSQARGIILALTVVALGVAACTDGPVTPIASPPSLTVAYDSNPDRCIELECRSLASEEFSELTTDMQMGQYYAAMWGDMDCWEVFSRAQQLLYNNEVYVMEDAPREDDTVVAGYWEWPAPNEVYLAEEVFQTPTDRAVTMAHEAIHDLMGTDMIFAMETTSIGSSESYAENKAANCQRWVTGG